MAHLHSTAYTAIARRLDESGADLQAILLSDVADEYVLSGALVAKSHDGPYGVALWTATTEVTLGPSTEDWRVTIDTPQGTFVSWKAAYSMAVTTLL